MYTGNLIGGRYRLARRIGAGNMGVVFEVEDQQTGRKVALKQVLYGSKEHHQRLLREARVCQRLRHPNIIEVLDIGVTETGAPFLVMPLLTGETIADLLKRKRRVAPMLAAQVGRDIATALAAAHAEGIIHRDLKPANVFIHRPGKAERPIIKVLDFGVCKEVNSRMTVLTSAGNVVGTPAYMSPEQLKNADLDARSDIWSLGVVLFEMLTGVRPFRGEGVELFLKILNGEIPTVSQLVRSVPPGLADVIARCLTRERAMRIGSAEEVVAQLAEVLQEGAAASTGSPITEQAGSTSSGMATHLGSQTVSGAILVEAGAAAMGALIPKSGMRPQLGNGSEQPSHSKGEAPADPNISNGVGGGASGTLRSQPECGSDAPGFASAAESPLASALSMETSGIDGLPAGASGLSSAAIGSGTSMDDFATSLGDETASAELMSRSLPDAGEAPSMMGLEHAGAMALDNEALDSVSHRMLLAIGAGALMLALVSVGLYAAMSSTQNEAVAQAIDFSVVSVPVTTPPPTEEKKETTQPVSPPLPPSSSPASVAANLSKPRPKQQVGGILPATTQRSMVQTSSVKAMVTPAQRQAASTNKAPSSPKPASPVQGNTGSQGAPATKSAKACGGKVVGGCIRF